MDLMQQRWRALQGFHRSIGMEGTVAMRSFLQRQDLHLGPCSPRKLDNLVTLPVRHGVTHHNNLYRTLRQHLFQPGKPAAYLRRKIPLQDALPGKEQHVVMSITKQPRATIFHIRTDHFPISQDWFAMAFSFL
jgi:hypothetical protein